MPDGVPPIVATSFASLFPAMVASPLWVDRGDRSDFWSKRYVCCTLSMRLYRGFHSWAWPILMVQRYFSFYHTILWFFRATHGANMIVRFMQTSMRQRCSGQCRCVGLLVNSAVYRQQTIYRFLCQYRWYRCDVG